MNTTHALGAPLAAAGLIVAGCGSDSSSSTTSTTALTKSEFLAQGNAICAKGNKAINQAAQETFNKQQPSASQLNQFATQTLIPNIQQQIDGIKALPAPSGDEAQVTAIVTARPGRSRQGQGRPPDPGLERPGSVRPGQQAHERLRLDQVRRQRLSAPAALGRISIAAIADTADDLAAQAREAEAAGIDCVWTPELFRSSVTQATWIAAADRADRRRDRDRLGVHPQPLHPGDHGARPG